MSPLFSLGQLVATPGVLESFTREFITECLQRHQSLDWGTINAEDARSNDLAIKHGGRIFSAYELNGVKIWIITETENEEGKRASTCALLPSEY